MDYERLHKLTAIKSEEKLERILKLLWETRKTGLSASQKSSVQSILELPSIAQLDPVLACLRSLIRKCVRENIVGDDILKMMPPDLPLELQSMLHTSLQKYLNQWREEQNQDQHISGENRFLQPQQRQLNAGLPTPLASFSSSSGPTVLQYNNYNLGGGVAVAGESNMSCLLQLPLQNDVRSLDTLDTLPRLKSMTWVIDNKNTPPANRVATITLKLQDCSKSLLTETEVKFQLNKDTLEAVLRSLAYIREQLSSSVRSSSASLQKKQRQ